MENKNVTMTFITKLVNRIIFQKRKELPFIIFSVFLVTFILARAYVYVATFIFPEIGFFLYIKGVHVHHLSYGIILLAITGFLALIDVQRDHIRKIAIFYSIGLALAFDEFGMWLHLRDDYWIRQSYDAIIVIAAIFLSIIYFKPFWRVFGKAFKRIWHQLRAK